MFDVELRNSALEMSSKYPRKLIRRILKLDPWRLTRNPAKNQPKGNPIPYRRIAIVASPVG
jgi:hypothetical protein